MSAPLLAGLLAGALCALALTAAPVALGGEPSWKAGEASAQEGAVRAVLTYREGLGGPLPYYDLKLAISRSGTVVYEQPVASHFCPSGCEPESLGASDPVAVSDLEGNSEQEVALALTTGGAHCCSVVQVLVYDAEKATYRIAAEHDFGDPGARLTTLEDDPHPDFESGDDRFAYEFAPYAASAFPLQVWRFQEGRFLNVTRSFPKRIAAQAASLFKGFLAGRRSGEGLGALAAWAADEDLLGHRALVSRTLAREARHGRLRSREHYAPSGEAFVRALTRFLKRTGYA